MKTSALILSALLAAVAVALGGGCAATPTRESTGEYIDNAAITAKVKAALIEDEIVKARDVQVETFRGRVQLSGFVDTQAQKDRATSVVMSVEGVQQVANNLIVK